MSRQGQVTSRINEQDHVKPGVVFPSVVSVHDVTANLFLYVLANVVTTRHYGAQTTRTGTMTNHLVAIALTDGEVFSNLKFTQRLYDAMLESGAIVLPDPVDVSNAIERAQSVVPELLKEDGVTVHQLIMGTDLSNLLAGMRPENSDQTRQRLEDAFKDSRAYYDRWVAKAKK
jgi:CRISPR-associated protein Csc2